jgi:hypothetical protein
MRSNGEVEGSPRSARLEPRVHTAFPHPRRHYRLSRTPPTIVRGRAHRGWVSILSLMSWIRGPSIQPMIIKGRGPRRIPRSIQGTSGLPFVMRQSMRYKQPPRINQPRKSLNDLSFMPVGVMMPVGANAMSEKGQIHVSQDQRGPTVRRMQPSTSTRMRITSPWRPNQPSSRWSLRAAATMQGSSRAHKTLY